MRIVHFQSNGLALPCGSRSWGVRMAAKHLIAYAIIAAAILIAMAIAILSRRRRRPPTHERIDLFRDGR
jgi:hypothetical protein